MTDGCTAKPIESYREEQMSTCYVPENGYYCKEAERSVYKQAPSSDYMLYKDMAYPHEASEQLASHTFYADARKQMAYKHQELEPDMQFAQSSYNGNSQVAAQEGSAASGTDHAAHVARIEFSKKWSDTYKTLLAQSEPQNCYVNSMNNKAQFKQIQRPELDLKVVEMLNDLSEFLSDSCFHSYIVKYNPRTVFHLGEGGRELLRACLNLKGCKGKQLQGASVPVLFNLANKWGLWNIALRINIERKIGVYSPYHAAFTRFKANQSHMRKYVVKEYMVTNRDNDGRISSIVYQENRKIILGKEGREALRTQLRQLHGQHPKFMDAILERHGFKYAELRNATVNQLSRMAFICNLWDNVINVCRKQEEINDKIKRRRYVKNSSSETLESKAPAQPQFTPGIAPIEPNSAPSSPDPASYCKNFPETYSSCATTSVESESPYLGAAGIDYLNCNENARSSASTHNYYTNFWSNDGYDLHAPSKYNYTYPTDDSVSVHWN